MSEDGSESRHQGYVNVDLWTKFSSRQEKQWKTVEKTLKLPQKMPEENSTDGDESGGGQTATEDEEEEPNDDSAVVKPPAEVIRQLKPDPEDKFLREDVQQHGGLTEDWLEEAFDPDYEQPKLTPELSLFLRNGYAKLGRRLSQDLMGEGLSMVAKAISGLSHAYVRLELRGRAIIDIALVRDFCNLRYVSLAGNHILSLAPLNSLQFLMTLDVSDNYLDSMADFGVHNHLKTLNVSKNFLRNLTG